MHTLLLQSEEDDEVLDSSNKSLVVLFPALEVPLLVAIYDGGSTLLLEVLLSFLDRIFSLLLG